MATGWEFCLLGPLLVRYDGVTIAVSPGKQHALLATLLLNANRAVAVDELAAVLWGQEPPRSARAGLQTYVLRLRKALGADGRPRIIAAPGGYQIKLAAGELDTDRFAAALGEARTAAADGRPADAAAVLRAALGLWRGEPLAGVPSELLAQREVPRLAEMRLQAHEARALAELRLGQPATVIAELTQLTAAHPLRERLHLLLMLALYQDGQQAAALAAYQSARTVLTGELGLEPGPELRRMQQQILAARPAGQILAGQVTGEEAGQGEAGRPGQHGRSPAALVPRQLPAAVPQFAGRPAELAELDRVLERPARAGTPVIAGISGTAGVGKSTLAVHWAHRVAGRFPDGQLYLNLRGFDPSGKPLSPAEAVRHCLDGLGVPAARVPAGLDAQAALYRSRLAGRQMLILLDNARDPAQVRSLLPAGAGCLVLVTSRDHLAGLAAAEGARLLVLDVLGAAAAREMLAGQLGPARVAAEPAAVAELTALCAGLPLALGITAGRAAARPGVPLAELAAGLRGTTRLDALATGETVTDLRSVFSWSLEQLSKPALRVFRLLGVHPGPDITGPAAASLAGLPPPRAGQALAELLSAHLLTESAPGRYALHDLLRAYAGEQAGQLTAASRAAARRRMLGHYLHSGCAAAQLVQQRPPITPEPLARRVQPESFDSREQALDWFRAERPVLVSVIGRAAAGGFSAHCWQLGWATAPFFSWYGYSGELAVTQQHSLDSLRQLGELRLAIQAGRLTSLARSRLGEHAASHASLTEALALARQAGHVLDQVQVLSDLSEEASRLGRGAEAVRYAGQALRLTRGSADRIAHAIALNNLGWSQLSNGGSGQAIRNCQRALALGRELGSTRIEVAALDSLGCAHRELGQHAQAVECHRQALQAQGEAADPHFNAALLANLGDAQQAAGDVQGARAAWQQALDLVDRLDEQVAGKLRARLAGRWPPITAPAGLAR